MSAIAKVLDDYTALVESRGFRVIRDVGGPLLDLPAEKRAVLKRFAPALTELYEWSSGADVELDGEWVPFGISFRFDDVQLVIRDLEIEQHAIDDTDLDRLSLNNSPSNALFAFFDYGSSGFGWFGYPRNRNDDTIFFRSLEGSAELTGLSLLSFLRLHHQIVSDPTLKILDQVLSDTEDDDDLWSYFSDAWRSALTGVPPEPRQSDEFYAQQAEAALASMPPEKRDEFEQLEPKARARAYKLLGRIGLVPRPIPVTKEDLGDEET